MRWVLQLSTSMLIVGAMILLAGKRNPGFELMQYKQGPSLSMRQVGARPEPVFAASVGRMKQDFEDAFRRGELSSSSLIHIDVPIRKWRFGFKHGQNLVDSDTPKLTRLEAETKEEVENDPGGLARVKASGSHMAKRE
jgi:hypothetical protein